MKQKPLDGVSLCYTFDNAAAPTRHGTQYFEIVGNRAIYKDGWMASTTPLRLPWVTSGFEPAPDFKNKSWTIAAQVTIPSGGASGVLATMGGRYGGWALLMQDSKPVFAYSYSNQPQHKYRVASDQPLAAGNHIIRVKFDYDGGGIGKGATATLLIDEKQVAEGRIPQTIAVRFSLDETFDIGQDTGTPVLEEYESKMPFPFTGTLTRFAVILQPQLLSEDEQDRLHQELAKAMMAVQ